MKAILIFAVLALAIQAQTPIHDFYHSFVSNLHMDAATQNQVLNDGLECINYALTTVAGAVHNIEHDVAAKNYLTVIREAITSIQTMENEVFPRCVGAYVEIVSYLQHNSDLSYVNSEAKLQLFQAKIVQLFGQVVFDVAFEKETNEIAHDFATFFNAASGLISADLPETLNMENFFALDFDVQRFVPQFFKGFFTTLGFNNMTQINATSQCVLDLGSIISIVLTNPALKAGDDAMIALTLREGLMHVTAAWERCKRLDTVDLSLVSRFVSLLEEETAQTLFMIAYNSIMNLPILTQDEINMNVYLKAALYEEAGQVYGNAVKKTFENILF